MRIRKSIPLILLTAVSSAAVAEWQLIGSNGKEFSVFSDPDAVQRSGATVTVPQLVTYGDPQPARVTGRNYLSERSQIEYDCASKRARTVSTEQYAGDRATGNLVFRATNDGAQWAPIPNRTNMEEAWWRACNRS